MVLKPGYLTVAYLGGVAGRDGFTCIQSQLTDVILARDDEMTHDEGEVAETALAWRQRRADSQEPLRRLCRFVCQSTQSG